MKLVSVEAIVDSDTKTWRCLNNNVHVYIKDKVYDSLWNSVDNPISAMLGCVYDCAKDRIREQI